MDLSADDMKVRLMAWLIPQLGFDDLLASELRFLDGSRRADLAVCSDKSILAVEIKGPRDNLEKLVCQLTDYKAMFNEVYVATTSRFLPKIRVLAPTSIGIIEVDVADIRLIRKSRKKEHLEPLSSCRWLTASTLRRLARQTGPLPFDFDNETARKILTKNFERSTLHSLAISSIRKTLANRHQGFIAELGKTPTLDDLKMLTIEDRIKL